MFQYDKTDPYEKHLITQSMNSGKTAAVIQQMTQAVPATGNFSSTPLYTLASTWTLNTSKTIGQKVFPTVNNGYVYQCSKTGTTGATEPTWGTTEYGTTTDGTTSWICRKGELDGTFSEAPDGYMAYANGLDVLLYGGDESRVAKFINYDPNGLFFYDYTDRVASSDVSTEGTATLKPTVGGIDSSTEVLLHLDDNVTDSSSNEFTVTAVGTPSYGTAKFGTKCIALNGSSQYLTVPDDAAFDFSSGSWAFDTWIAPTTAMAAGSIFYQGLIATPTEDYVKIEMSATGVVTLTIKSGNVVTLSLATGAGALTVSTWQHLEISENGDNYYIFVNGVLKAYTSSTARTADYDGVVVIGGVSDYGDPVVDVTEYLKASLDELRISSRYRHTSAFTVMAAAYGADSKTYLYISSLVPIDGIKFYISTPNATTCASPTIYYWNTTDWATVGTVTDGTIVGGKTMAQTGTMTFTSTVSTAKLKPISNFISYWYKVEFATLDDTTSIFYCTLKTSMQPLKDIWDNQERLLVSCQKYVTAYEDNTTNVLKSDAQTYYSGSAWIYPPETYLGLGSFAITSYLYLGFLERQTGVYFYMPHDQVNTTSATLTVEYWDGSGWSSVGTVEDQTLNSASTVAMSNAGMVIWSPIEYTNEFKTSVSTDVELYYYRFHWSGTLSADTKVDYISGIASPTQIDSFNFPVMWLSKLWLCGKSTGSKNLVKSSNVSTAMVFNGDDSTELRIGTNEEIVAGCSVFSRFLSTVEETLILLKKKSVWVLDGSDPEDIKSHRVSSQYGCTAPKTLKVCDIGVQISEGVNKAVAIWQSSNGIMMFDNGSLLEISRDIENYFTNIYDTSITERLNPDAVEKSVAFYDPALKRYHWLFAAGTSATLNREYVYDIMKKKWFRIDRGTNNYLQSGFYITDEDGNSYVYGATDSGYIHRLNYGNTFNGTSITSTFKLSDKPLDKTMFTVSNIRAIKLTSIAKTTDATLDIYYYKDGNDTGVLIGNIDQTGTDRVFQTTMNLDQSAIFHAFGGVITSDDTSCSCEPLAAAIMYKKIRYETNRRD
jgi:hypothetical protein